MDSRFRLHGVGSLRGDGDGSPYEKRVGVDSRFRLTGTGLYGEDGDGAWDGWGWIPASVFTGAGFSAGGRGWVPASARTTGGGGFPLPSSRGQALCGGTGMGPRIREDNGWGWIPASVVTGAGFLRGDGDGSPHPRGQRVGVDSRFRRHGDRLLRGDGGASAGTTGGGGFPHPSSRGQAPAGDGDGSPHPRGQRVGVDSRFRRGALRGDGEVPASARTTGGGGFPLPSSRGQALCGGDGDGSPHPRGQRVGAGMTRRGALG